MKKSPENNLNMLCQQAQNDVRFAESKLFELLLSKFGMITGYRINNNDDAKEVCQIALQVIAEKYKNTVFKISFASWAYKILENKIYNYIENKMKVESRKIVYIDNGYINDELGSDSDSELKRKLIRCLRKISKNNTSFARVIVLQFQGYTTNEICDRLKTSSNNLYVMISRSKALLKKCLETGDIK